MPKAHSGLILYNVRVHLKTDPADMTVSKMYMDIINLGFSKKERKINVTDKNHEQGGH